MKKLLTLIAILAINFTLFSQAPQRLSYQAVIRNSSGGLVTSHAVGMKISILQGSATGTAVYIETHTPTTNANGLATVEIGGGSVVSGTFTGINWGSGTYFIKTETDPAGGSSYTIVGTSQLLSVPFALYSKTSGEMTLPYSANATLQGPVLEIKNNYYSGMDVYNRIGIKGISAALYGIGIYGEALSDVGGNHSRGVYGIASSDMGIGVFGENTNLESGGFGVTGQSHSTTGKGVFGFASATTGINYGVRGESMSTSGYGVFGKAEKFGVYGESPKYGVYGKSSSATGRAVMGEALGTGSIGLYGKALADNSTGVWGEGANYDFYANGPGTNYGSPSSVRWKNNITVIPNPLEMIKALRGVYFNWNEEHGGIHDVGFIAEEVGKVLPEIVVYEENGMDASGLDYSKITPLLLEAIKAQQEEIESLRARLEKIEEKIGK